MKSNTNFFFKLLNNELRKLLQKVLYMLCLYDAQTSGRWQLLVISLLSSVTLCAGLNCLQCTNVPLPRDCGKVTKCGSNEACFIETYATGSGAIRYNLGCRDTQFCIGSSGRRFLPSHGVTTSIINITNDEIESSYDSDGAILSRDNSGGSADDVMLTSSGDVKVCESCCNTKLCNNAGCGSTGYPADRGPVCYTCDQHISPHSCDTISICGKSSICKIKLTAHPTTGDVYYTSKCEDPQVCHQDVAFQNLIVGRKRFTGEEVDTSTKKCLVKCCDGDLCTGSCGSGSVSGTVVTGSTTAPNPCASNPCVHGICQNSGTSYRCQCNNGYTGTKCHQAITSCAGNPCVGFGTCHLSGSSSTCTCKQGWIGATCHQNAVSVSHGCFLGWKRHGSSCYLFVTTPANWNHAQASCRGYVGYLAEVNDHDEQNFLAQQITLSHKGDFWIGAIYRNGRWAWDHSKQYLTDHSMYWDKGGYPAGHTGNCVKLHEDSHSAWRNYYCSHSYGYICEKPASAW